MKMTFTAHFSIFQLIVFCFFLSLATKLFGFSLTAFIISFYLPDTD